MGLVPVSYETIVSSHTVTQIKERLEDITSIPMRSHSDMDKNTIFIGEVYETNFRLSLKVQRPDNFLPVITGRIDETSRGCIIYLKYSLFFSSMLFLTFWSFICLTITLFFGFIVQKSTYAMVALGVGLINYIVTVTNFNRKVTESHLALIRALKID